MTTKAARIPDDRSDFMTESLRPRRSALYIPGSNNRGLDKGRSIPADVLILDLEDAVAPEDKPNARAAVASAVNAHAYEPREVVVRVNGLDTPWIGADIVALAGAPPDAILVPKVSRVEDVQRAKSALQAAQTPRGVALWVMIETPLGVLNAKEIAASAADPDAEIAAMVIGTNDLGKETGTRIQPGRALMLPWLAQILAAGRAFGLAVLDGTYIDLDDTDGLRSECRQGRDLGMDGKTLIHPKQVPIANEVFSPSADDLAWAREVIAAFSAPENIDKAVIKAGGRMIERLHERMAQRILKVADEIERIERAS
jgi:citrate lyase subunit beta / citryl-CoA lyase